MKIITCFFIILVAAYFIGSCICKSDVRELTGWVHSQGQTVRTIDRCMWNTGPYFNLKGARYYRVRTDKNTYWVRYMLGRHIEQEVNGNYKPQNKEEKQLISNGHIPNNLKVFLTLVSIQLRKKSGQNNYYIADSIKWIYADPPYLTFDIKEKL